jgi:uncharacterized membrane protein YphA (DoxX/SURF4 family)
MSMKVQNHRGGWRKIPQIVKYLILAIFGLQFVVAGTMKLVPTAYMVHMYELFGYGHLVWLRICVGVIEVLFGPLILFPRTRLVEALATGTVNALLIVDVFFRYKGNLPPDIAAISVPAVITVLVMFVFVWFSRPRSGKNISEAHP